MEWLRSLSWWQLTGLVVLITVVCMVIAAWLTAVLVRRGLRTPWAVHQVNRVRERVITLIKRPITIMVLDEVADVIQTATTRAISPMLWSRTMTN